MSSISQALVSSSCSPVFFRLAFACSASTSAAFWRSSSSTRVRELKSFVAGGFASSHGSLVGLSH